MINKNYKKTYKEINEKKYYFIESGSGYPIVLLPGWMSIIDKPPYTRIYNSNFTKALDGFHFHMIHLSNFYKSDFDSKINNIDAYADDLKQFVDIMGWKQFHLIGHSAGGRLAIYFTAKYPEYVNKLVLMNAAGLKHRKADGKMMKKVHYYFGKFFASKEEQEFLRPILKNMFDFEISALVPAIKKKTLIIWGGKDKLISVTKGKQLHEMIVGSEMIVYDELDHMTVTKSEVYVDIFNFLKQDDNR